MRAAALSFGATLPSLAAAQAPEFSEVVPLTPSLFNVSQILILDVDEDGDLDQLFLSMQDSVIYWSETTGAGDVAPPRTLLQFDEILGNVATIAESAVLADMDGDGVTELIVGLRFPARLVRFPRISSAAFGAPVTLAGGMSFNSLAAVDVDADGDLDLLASRLLGGSDTVLLRNDAGSLGAPSSLGSGGRALRVGDLDGDGRPDVVAVAAHGLVHVLRNNGTVGPWPDTVLTEARGAAPILELADLTGDGQSDLVLADAISTRPGLEIWKGDGTGSFSPLTSFAASPNPPRSAAVLDVDADGDKDVVYSEQASTAGVYVIENLAPEVFAPAPVELYALPSPGALAAADLDLDGAADLVVTDAPNHALALTSRGAGALPAELETTTDPVLRATDAAVLDADADGDVDIVVASTIAGVSVLRGDGVGNFGELDPLDIGPAFPDVLVAADLDADGALDLLLQDREQDSLRWLSASGGFDSVPRPIATSPGGFDGRPMVVDVNQDGDIDVLARPNVDHRVRAYLQSDGSFQEGPLFDDTGWDVVDASLADLDTDGISDLVTVELVALGSSRVVVRRGLPGGGFAPGTAALDFELNDSPGPLAFEDVDRDGHLDLVVITTLDTGLVQKLRVARSRGDTTFDPAIELATLDLSRSLVATARSNGRTLVAWSAVFGSNRLHYSIAEIRPDFTLGDVFSAAPESRQSRRLQFVDLGRGAMDLLDADDGLAQIAVLRDRSRGVIGESECGPAVPNSSGAASRILALGSASVAVGDLELVAQDLPPHATTFFLASRDPDFVPRPGGSQGNLCLGGSIGRAIGPGLVGMSTAGGLFRRSIDPAALPQPTSSVPAMAGESWYFQAWHRDMGPSHQSTSNFTDAVRIDFR